MQFKKNKLPQLMRFKIVWQPYFAPVTPRHKHAAAGMFNNSREKLQHFHFRQSTDTHASTTSTVCQMNSSLLLHARK